MLCKGIEKMTTKLGYARVSTEDQKLDLQMQALQKEGCQEIYSDQGFSGKSFNRPGLDKVLKKLKSGDTLVVWRLDRLGRSLLDLVHIINQLRKRGIHFHSLSEHIDTSSSGGMLVFHMMAALAEFERSLISERTRAGMEAARRGGQHLGRRPILSDDELKAAVHALNFKGERLEDVAHRHGLAPRSLQRMIQNRTVQFVA
jgi:DNA invertase Pin-like site-specific DNA recombinase